MSHDADLGAASSVAAPWLLLAICGFCYFTQSFSAWAWPALDGYPAIERWIDPTFLTSDFYTNTTTGYGVDTWQAVLFGTIQQQTGIHYAWQIAALTALRCLLWPTLLYFFMSALLRNAIAARIAVVLGLLAGFTLPDTLGWQWLWGDGSPAMFAVFAMTLAWLLFLKRRPASAFLALACATLFQPLVGVHGIIFAGLICVLDYDLAERRAAIARPAVWAAAFVFGATLASQFLALSPASADRLPIADYTHILVWERHPSDFLVSRFDPDSMIAALIGAAAILAIAVREWRYLRRARLILASLAVYAIICIAGYLFVELYPVRFVIDLIPYRTASIGAPLMLAIVASWTARMLGERRWTLLALIAIAFVIAGPVGGRLHIPAIAGAAVLLLAACVALAGLRLPTDRAAETLAAYYRLGWLPVAGLLLMIGAERLHSRHSVMTVPTAATMHPLYDWARDHTDKSARFLIDQISSDYQYGSAITPQAMRLIGRRAVAASRDYPFRDSDMREWYRTWAVGLGHGQHDFVDRLSPDEIRSACRDLPFDYIVRRTPLSDPAMPEVARFPAFHGIGDVHVYKACGGTS